MHLAMPSGLEIGLIVLAVLVLFGAKKIPEFARGLGKGIHEFKDAVNNSKKEIIKAADDYDESESNKKTDN